MDERAWPEVEPETQSAMRAVAQSMLTSFDALGDEIFRAAQQHTRYDAVVTDPTLADADRHLIEAHLVHWLTATVQAPGRPVAPTVDPGTLQYARDLLRRGMDADDLGAWRAAHHVAWRWWVERCVAAVPDRTVLIDVLVVSERSMVSFIDDATSALAAYIDEQRTDLARAAHAERHATVQLVLEGAPVNRPRAEAKLGYGLTGPHVAAIVWTENASATPHLEAAAERLMRVGGATRRLTLVASASALWLWMPLRELPSVTDLRAVLDDVSDARVALGRPGDDVEGFRRTHLDAAAAQRVLTRLASRQRVVRFEDVQLVAAMSADLSQAEQFVADTLGAFADADASLHDTVLTYINEQFNKKDTAVRLFTHRNTVERRLSRADELLPKPLAQIAPSVAAALMFLQLRDGH